MDRRALAALSLSGMGLVAIVMNEGYNSTAYIPIKGDVATIGFGSTKGVKLGDKTTPQNALKRALTDINQFEGALKKCVKVPLTQGEYDAYISLSYNIAALLFVIALSLNGLTLADTKMLVLKYCNGIVLKVKSWLA